MLLKCHAGCTAEAVVGAMGLTMADLFDRPLPALTRPVRTNGRLLPAPQREPDPEPEERRIVHWYEYHNRDGSIRFKIARYAPKDFRPFHPDPTAPGGWRKGMGEVTPILYNLPAVREAVERGDTVLLVEGEKDADRLNALGGLVATTAPFGAAKWRDEYADDLGGADVRILPDNDPAGERHTQRVARGLYGKAESVRVVDLPDLPEKGDVSDWLDAGHDGDKLVRACDAAPLWTPSDAPEPEVAVATTDADAPLYVTLAELLRDPAMLRPPEAVHERFAWRGRVTLLAAREKAGKTTLAAWVAAQVSGRE